MLSIALKHKTLMITYRRRERSPPRPVDRERLDRERGDRERRDRERVDRCVQWRLHLGTEDWNQQLCICAKAGTRAWALKIGTSSCVNQEQKTSSLHLGKDWGQQLCVN